MHTKEDIDKLIQAVIADITMADAYDMPVSEAVREAVDKFREPRPRVGVAWYGPIEGDSPPFFEGSVKAIELTEAVRTRLGPTAGVDRERIYRILEDDVGRCDGALVDAIMALLKDAGVEITDEQ